MDFRRSDGRSHCAPLAVALSGLLVFAAGGCATAPELVPAPSAQMVPEGPGRGAMDAVQGVRVIARSDAWSGFPDHLDRVTPILVTIDNQSKVPLRIRYNEFALVDQQSGARYNAIPPFSIEGTESEPIDATDFSGFRIAPYHARYYPGLVPYDGLFPFDQFYYDSYYPAWVDVELPTGDMIQKALPEGVIEPGGRISGFVYFENVHGHPGQVEFMEEVVNAANGERLGMIDIPFSVH